MDQVNSDGIEGALEERDGRQFTVRRIEEIVGADIRTEYREYECVG